MTVFALWSGNNIAPKLLRNEVQSITDAQHGESLGQHALIGRRSVSIIHRRRATAKNDPGRVIAFDLVKRSGAGQNNGKDFQFTDAARDELRILRAEVEDDNRLFFHG